MLGALVVGGPGAGKSTTALACAASGFGFLGDDHIGIEEADDGGFFGHSLYSTARLSSEQLVLNPELGCGAPVLEKISRARRHCCSLPTAHLSHSCGRFASVPCCYSNGTEPRWPSTPRGLPRPYSEWHPPRSLAWREAARGRSNGSGAFEARPRLSQSVTNGKPDAIPALVDEALAQVS